MKGNHLEMLTGPLYDRVHTGSEMRMMTKDLLPNGFMQIEDHGKIR